MPKLRHEPERYKRTVALVSGECFQGIALDPKPPPGFIRLLGLDKCGGGSPWCSVTIPIQNVKYILTEVDSEMGQKVSIQYTTLSPDIVVEQRAKAPKREVKAVHYCPCGGLDVLPDDTAGSEAKPHRFDCPRGGKGHPEPKGTAMDDPNPRPEPDADDERWSRHE